MLGTGLNIAAILIGGALGMLLGSRLPERVRKTVIAGLGLFTLAVGFQMFLKTQNALIVLGSLLIGVILGEWWKIEEGLQWLGSVLERRFANAAGDPSGRFVRGFLTASLVFCVGPMAILGSIQAGISGDISLLAIKSVLDGFTALAFASTLGLGVLFSGLVILFYQGGLTLLATQVQAISSTTMMNELTATGGVILIGVAISSLLEIKKVRVGSFLPALLIAPVIVAVISRF